MLVSRAIASDKSHSASGTGSVLPGCLLAVLECSGDRVHLCELGRSPAGVRETDRGWTEGSPALGQPSRAGACSPPGPLLPEPDPWAQLCQEV